MLVNFSCFSSPLEILCTVKTPKIYNIYIGTACRLDEEIDVSCSPSANAYNILIFQITVLNSIILLQNYFSGVMKLELFQNH